MNPGIFGRWLKLFMWHLAVQCHLPFLLSQGGGLSFVFGNRSSSLAVAGARRSSPKPAMTPLDAIAPSPGHHHGSTGAIGSGGFGSGAGGRVVPGGAYFRGGVFTGGSTVCVPEP